MKSSLNIIRIEHRNLAAVLHGLQRLVDSVRKGTKPDFTTMRAVMYYIDTFPEKLHHPKEDRYLFARLRQRTHKADAALAQLQGEHRHGEKLIRDLEQALLRWEMGGEKEFAAFADELVRYADFQWRHMQLEEEVILPLAQDVLTEEDWRDIDAAFARNEDPLVTKDVEKDYEQLFKRILSVASPPIPGVRAN